MVNKVNAHVERLHRYLPFNPSHDQIYEEYQTTDDSLNLETKALAYLKKSVKDKARLIILTGDAGHGKTHLCRRLIEYHFSCSQKEARDIINTQCDGKQFIDINNTGQPLRIYKDFSEMGVDIASEHIEKALNDDRTTIVCANEGRLRAILEYGKDLSNSQELLKQFKDSFKDGVSSHSGLVHIVNLNYQSVASTNDQSLVSMAMKAWVDGKRWSTCQSCDSKEHCPILFNRNQLSHRESKKASIRLNRIELLFATAERLGAVITIREILMAIAYFLTGGLGCLDVHQNLRKKKAGWQSNYAYYNLLFKTPPEISSDKLKKISVLSNINLLDPGKKSLREVDEKLINEQGIFEPNSIDLQFTYRSRGKVINVDASNGIDEVISDPRSKREQNNEAIFIQELVQSIRRKLYFEDQGVQEMGLLGFEHGNDFIEVLAGNMTATKMKTVKNKLIAGLHTIQGLQIGDDETTLHIVDPSFTSSVGHTAIIAKKIPTTLIKILSMNNAWNTSDGLYDISSSVDWLDRHIVFRIEDRNLKPFDFPLNLMVFDCIARASSGYVAEEFYAHDLRRIKTFLGSITQQHVSEEGNIPLFINGKMRSISIDEGVIQIGGSL
ncbi:hypothetical protein KUC3_39410 [Alteromonas sp. KC3]|uniref:hypothetical protein n=1 Tax=unclassified Alteromonas TaxID=2614992 RepID=UPI00192328BF|nr:MULTISPECIES: hypothetical protein [unclassified Alteromonas]BCO21084.1 hypothetical protein KUC3_39410 [Alteromonas sp. KC3]BCO25054.1 hypothetical protein KUC14_39230 [Alteromonas sp. KC14]